MAKQTTEERVINLEKRFYGFAQWFIGLIVAIIIAAAPIIIAQAKSNAKIIDRISRVEALIEAHMQHPDTSTSATEVSQRDPIH